MKSRGPAATAPLASTLKRHYMTDIKKGGGILREPESGQINKLLENVGNRLQSTLIQANE